MFDYKIVENRGVDYKHEGYSYVPWNDYEVDNVKIFHDILTPSGECIWGPWSPYKIPTLAEFCEYVDELKKDDSDV